MVVVTDRLDRLVRELVAAHRGTQVKPRGEGDSHFLVFDDPVDAVSCAVELQRTVVPLGLPVRSACHVGDAEFRNGDWYGTTVNRTARLRAAAHGGQALASAEVATMIGSGTPPSDLSLRSLGRHRLKDIDEPVEVFQVCASGLVDEHPPLPTLARSHGIPLPGSSFIGRSRDLDQIVSLLDRGEVVAVTGAPGSGTTRLALEAAAAWWEADGRPLRVLTDPVDGEVVGAAVADTAGPAVVSGSGATALSPSTVIRLVPLDDFDAEHLLRDRLPPDMHVATDLVAFCSGLPLAIELLARRAASVGPEVLAERLAADPLDVLGGNRRAEPPRHRSMRATLEAVLQQRGEFDEADRALPLVAEFLRQPREPA